MKKFLIYVSILFIITGCKKSAEDTSGIKQISYGNSFGMCTGYCMNEVSIDKISIILQSSGWNNSVKPTYCKAPITTSKWDSLSTKADINSFFKMKDVIGCPDCADGGAEWVEIKLNSGKSHRVTFEYLHEPAELKTIVADLRFALNKTPCMTIVE